MIYDLTLPDTFEIPNGHAHRSAFIKGAIAWKDGKLMSANPYFFDTAPDFFNAWYRGWSGANDGIIAVKVREEKASV